jgi:hypothetical protein
MLVDRWSRKLDCVKCPMMLVFVCTTANVGRCM